jgi:HTH-type transcriptional regulator / antitoxin HipB
MRLDPASLASLGPLLAAERKRQRLSREQAAAVCGVSPSFIRDAESAPGRCSLALLLQLISGLGLRVEVHGLQAAAAREGSK